MQHKLLSMQGIVKNLHQVSLLNCENRQWLGNYMAKIEAIEQGASIHCFSDYGIKHLAQVLGCLVEELVE